MGTRERLQVAILGVANCPNSFNAHRIWEPLFNHRFGRKKGCVQCWDFIGFRRCKGLHPSKSGRTIGAWAKEDHLDDHQKIIHRQTYRNLFYGASLGGQIAGTGVRAEVRRIRSWPKSAPRGSATGGSGATSRISFGFSGSTSTEMMLSLESSGRPRLRSVASMESCGNRASDGISLGSSSSWSCGESGAPWARPISILRHDFRALPQK